MSTKPRESVSPALMIIVLIVLGVAAFVGMRTNEWGGNLSRQDQKELDAAEARITEMRRADEKRRNEKGHQEELLKYPPEMREAMDKHYREYQAQQVKEEELRLLRKIAGEK